MADVPDLAAIRERSGHPMPLVGDSYTDNAPILQVWFDRIALLDYTEALQAALRQALEAFDGGTMGNGWDTVEHDRALLPSPGGKGD